MFAGLTVPKAIEANLPFKQKQRVSVVNDKTAIDKRRQTNLLERLNLPTKRPFKKAFMNNQEKAIHSMVQRLSLLDKEHKKYEVASKQKAVDRLSKRE